MNKSRITLAVLFLVAIVSAFAVAASAESFVIDRVVVNDMDADSNDYISVERGTTADIVVYVKTGENLTSECDVKIRANIDGYEESISDSSSMFTITPSNPPTKYQRTLNLELPSGMEEGYYNLYVEITSANNPTVEKVIRLDVISQRHLIDILGVVVPTPYILAGQTAEVEVRLRNEGAKDENDVKVVAAIDALKASAVKWTDLVAYEYVGDDEEDSETITLSLFIPADTVSGEYELAVGIAYNDEHDTQIVKTTINVKGVEVKAEPVKDEDGTQEPVIEEPKTPVDPSKELTISFDTTSQHVAVGKEIAYKLTISNLASTARDITLTSAGAQLFADVRIDPSVLTIEGGSKADVYVYAKPKSDAELKVSQFTLRVMDEGKLYKELSLSLGVEAAAAEKSTFLPFEDDTLKMVFIGLVILLIIVGLMIAFKRVRGDDYPLEPVEERIYY
ncbi:MAG: hypothetical protein WC852_07520 [Candidatus Nanoarchaeia archaeon]|jgi:hypothetical protein